MLTAKLSLLVVATSSTGRILEYKFYTEAYQDQRNYKIYIDSGIVLGT